MSELLNDINDYISDKIRDKKQISISKKSIKYNINNEGLNATQTNINLVIEQIKKHYTVTEEKNGYTIGKL